MDNKSNILFQFALLLFLWSISYSQTENVPANHPIYSFLKRMELKNIISNYHDAVLPLSRQDVAHFIVQVQENKTQLTNTENNFLNDYLIEFEFDIKKSLDNSFSLFGGSNDVVSGMVRGTFHDQEKHIYTYSDSILSVFVNGLINIDFRRSTGDGLHAKASFVEVGPRLRGTIYDKLGYYFQLTNAQFWGNREVLQRDKRISQSYALSTPEAKNFDFVEGYLRYDAGIISAQVGRERVLWGNSYGDKLFISDYHRVFDAVRMDAEYKNFKYTFLHGWLLGKPGKYLPLNNGDSEPIVADKYIAAHRFEFAINNYLDLGIQELSIYSNRSVDLGYLNPLTFFESVQRSRQERDNGFLAFDIQVRPFQGYEIQSTLFFDDIEIPKLGKDRWENKYALQFGLMAVDPLNIPNTNLMIEYTRVDPYMFSHNRSRENEYSSNNVLLGTQIGPNAESWFFKLDHFFSNRLTLTTQFEIQWSGENSYDSSGILFTNVGGNFLQPFRDGLDKPPTKFLDGILNKKYIGQFYVSYEIINDVWFDLKYEWNLTHKKNPIPDIERHNFGGAIRIDF
ncbi:MAG: capsule assembly Wzi family protein [Bacteroidota bacterium]|nr:capsule assembly Wzi family protein [Bacteroidota bacterium]